MESVRAMFGSPIPAMVALNVMGVNLIAPVLPAYADFFGVGFAAVSTLVTAFALARMSFRVRAGSLADRHGSRAVCTGGGFVQATGAIIASFAPGIGLLLVARGVQGVGSSLFGTSVNRYLLVTTERGDLGRATAGFQSGILVGGTIGPLIGGFVADRFGIFAPFYVQAAIALMLALVSRAFIRDQGDAHFEERRDRASIRSLVGIRGFKVVMFLGFGYFFVRAGAINVLVPAFADDVLALSPSLIGAIISFGSFVSLLVMPVAGHFADALGRWPVALTGALGTAAAVAAFGLADQTGGLFTVAAMLGVGIALVAVALPTMIGDLAPPGTEGRASGVYRIANDLGWIFGPATLGFLADGNRYGLAFAVAGVPLIIGAGVLLRGRDLRRGATVP